VREERDESDQRVEPSEPIKSSSCATSGTPCTRTPTCNEYGISCRHSGTASTSRITPTSEHTDGLIRKHKYVDITGNRECNNVNDTVRDAIERDYNDYVEHTYSAKGQGAGTGVRISYESRHIKQADADATDRVEECTGIPTGVTV
jgi:hypothetical protein